MDALGDLVESFDHQYPGVTGTHSRIIAQYADRCQADLVVMPDSVDAGAIPNAADLAALAAGEPGPEMGAPARA